MKRLFDLILSTSLVILLMPFILLICLLVLIYHGRPIFFRQQRPGYQGELFELIKFRTMLDSTDKFGTLLDDEKRITKFGQFLRSTSLDELPEFINVINGEMSLVGPRPLLEEYLNLYSTDEFRRHEVKPGITGWAQINGRNNLSWRQKFELDIWYVDNCSFWLDLKILFLTVLKVFSREGISEEGKVGAKKFKGHKK